MSMKEIETDSTHLEDMYAEMRRQFVGRNKFLDAVLPPLVFMLVNFFWSLSPALWAAISIGFVIAGLRVVKRERLWFAISGLAAVFAAAWFAWWMSRAESFFLPSIIANAILLAAFAGSLVIRRPLMAWGSYISRRWPLRWYWHPRIRPAYTEVSVAWTIFMAFRLVIQVILFQNSHINVLGVFQILTGSPATVLLLALTYLYGIWRLKGLKGPSVMEFEQRLPPPWEGQQRGF